MQRLFDLNLKILFQETDLGFHVLIVTRFWSTRAILMSTLKTTTVKQLRVTIVPSVIKHLKVQAVYVIIKVNIIRNTMLSNKSFQMSNIYLFNLFIGFGCYICGASFRNNASLKVHVRDIHEETNCYVCKFCDKVFKSKNTLANHRSLYHKGQR